MTPPDNEGRQTVAFLLQRGRLEQVAPIDLESNADALVHRAELRLRTSRAALAVEDIDGAFVAAYDAYRMAAESLLVRQGLRATGGDGSHVTVEDAVSAQFSGDVPAFAKPTFERFRRTRHAAQYFDPTAPDLLADDAEWAIATAVRAFDATVALSARNPPGRFEPPPGR